MPFCLHILGGRNVNDTLLGCVSKWRIEKGSSQIADFKSAATISEDIAPSKAMLWDHVLWYFILSTWSNFLMNHWNGEGRLLY